MKHGGWIAALAATLITVLIAQHYRSDLLISNDDFADLGQVTILHSPQPARDLVIVLSDSAATPPELNALATHGHLIAHVSLPHFLERAATNDDACINAVTLLDVFSQHLQERFRFTRYQRPILLGLDGAAPFALATAAQAPNRLFLAGIGAGAPAETTDMTLPKPLCAAPALTAERSGDHRYRITAHDNPTPWHTLARLDALPALLDELDSAVAAPDSIDDLALIELPLTPSSPAAADKSLDDLFVILLSGDGGWANIDKDIGEQLNRSGVPVIGWNSLQYFWSEKTPEQASHDLARTIAHYQQTWQRPRVLLIGFSMGADVLPFMINRLPDAAKSAIADTVFLGLGRTVDFQFHVTSWIGSSDDGRPIAPELATLKGMSLLCIYGKDDEDTMCGDKPVGLDVVELPGDHHFDGDYQRATQLILDHLHQPRATP
jgi:type IV secretory pathway VirJ component